jgi:hypothetical protein
MRCRSRRGTAPRPRPIPTSRCGETAGSMRRLPGRRCSDPTRAEARCAGGHKVPIAVSGAGRRCAVRVRSRTESRSMVSSPLPFLHRAAGNGFGHREAMSSWLEVSDRPSMAGSARAETISAWVRGATGRAGTCHIGTCHIGTGRSGWNAACHVGSLAFFRPSLICFSISMIAKNAAPTPMISNPSVKDTGAVPSTA